MKKILMVVTMIISLCVVSYSQDTNENIPTGGVNGKGTVLVRQGYVVSIVKGTGVAEWACYALKSSYVVENAERENNFIADPDAERLGDIAELVDYAKNGYDRGHLVPAEDLQRDQSIMNETFLLSNVAPQDPSFNRGIWKRLENRVRAWTQKKGNLNICVGPIYSGPVKTIGPNKVRVPDAFFKIVMDGKRNVIAFIMPNIVSKQDIFNYTTTVRVVEQKTGIDFYYKLNKNIQNTIETKVNVAGWN